MGESDSGAIIEGGRGKPGIMRGGHLALPISSLF